VIGIRVVSKGQVAVTEAEGAAPIDTSVSHPARRYNYWLGGKDNFQADRDNADLIEAAFPGVRKGVRANRQVLGRMIRFLAGEAGIRQFLDIGTGLPTADNTHEVAQRIAPESRVVYVDNDPLVLVHARALLNGSPEGRTEYIEADLREPERILRSAGETLDLSQPVGLMLIAILHFIPDRLQALDVVRRLTDALPPGSYLAATTATEDFLSDEERRQTAELRAQGKADIWSITKAEFGELFTGLDLVDPGIALPTRWRPDADTDDYDPAHVNMWAAVARKP
jgi:O-methyltransferase involved in polyketide biosynthesis